jgi:hypothetical protein
MAMRITKLPIPLLIAAAALTSVAVIYVYFTAPPTPIHTDRNFTTPLYAGLTYLWRGAAFEYIFSADYPVSIANGTAYHLIYLQGPLYNISLGGNVFILFGSGIRPIYVLKLPSGVAWYEHGVPFVAPLCLVFKLVDVTPPNKTTANLTLHLPKPFGENEVLTNKEDSVIYSFAHCSYRYRVINVAANGTHIIYRTMSTLSPYDDTRYLVRMSSPVVGKTIRVVNQPIRATYVVDDSTYLVMALPYLHFGIIPQETTTLVVYVR